jgi:mRNA interferase HicA
MNRQDFMRHLRLYGCVFVREGAKHSIVENPVNGFRSAVPRHTELKRVTCVEICKQLEIPSPFAR